jgi:hypothetical protein
VGLQELVRVLLVDRQVKRLSQTSFQLAKSYESDHILGSSDEGTLKLIWLTWPLKKEDSFSVFT